MPILKKLVFSISLLALTACGQDDDNNIASNAGQNVDSQQLEFRLSSIEPTQGQHYEGWIVNSSGVLSSGRFNVDGNGNVYSVDVDGNNLELIGQNNVASFAFDDSVADGDLFVLTIEPNGDSDPGPSDVHYLGGAFSNGQVVTTTDHQAAIGAEFLTSLGTYILATPTNGPTTHNQGIWFLDNGAPSLVLPQLNTGWAYEGWMVDTATSEVVSTGIFFTASGADSDGPGATAGPNPAPPFPGQDYINPARILNDGNHMTVITVEPHPDFDPAPFTLKILRHAIENGAQVTTPFTLENFSNENSISIEVTVR